MKSILLLVMTICSVVAVGQRKSAEDDPHWRQQVVQRAFSEVSAGLRTSWSERYLARLGDGTAPEILKILGSKPLGDKDAETALTLLRMSFADPRSIKRSSERTPTNTFGLLDYLDKHTTDADTKSKIKSTREQFQTKPSPAPNG